MTISRELEVIDHLDRIAVRHLIDHEGRVTCWREFGTGSGAPLVLLHGGHGSWLHWIRNIEALSGSRRVLVPDLPGYGDSDALRTDRDFAGLVDTVVASLGKLLGSGAAFDLAGFSFGGVVAACVALRHGGARSLALLGAVGHGMGRRQAGTMRGWRDADDEQTMLANMRHNLGVLMLHGPIDPLALQIHYRSCLRTRFDSKKTSLSPALTVALEELAIPVLMLWGEHDPIGHPGEVGTVWQGDRAERAHHIIPAAGHWVQYEAAQEVNRRLLDWFAVR
ncbi:alpha/beta fold hydrolase [Massilia sp. LXY-6]|uniref:alpha/beta fold hydrolase n=1 Tax=Massilia sp. LXY-6 TaxID=3379823 RepID=UPI003EE3FCBA